MTAAIVIFSGESFGGVERRFSRLAAYLSTRGDDLAVFMTADAQSTVKRLKLNFAADKLIAIDQPSAGGFFARKLNRMWGLIRLLINLKRLKITQVHFAMNPGLITWAYSLLGTLVPPYSVSMVDTTFEYRAGIFERFFFRGSIVRAFKVDCLSPQLKKVVLSSVPNVDAQKICVSPCSFTDYTCVKTIDARDIDVTMMSRWVPAKGLEILESAAHHLDGVVLHVCGNGPLKPSIPAAEIYEASDPFAVMARTKIFLSLQQYNNYPSQSLLEAMASGCAIIATDVGETRLLLDSECALLISYQSDDLARGIKLLLSDDALRERLGKAAQERVLKVHTVEAFSKYFTGEIMALKGSEGSV